MTVKIKGGPELAKLLDQLPEQIARNVLRGGLRAGAKIIAGEAKAEAPPGVVKEAVRFGSRTGKNGQVYGYVRTGGKFGFLGRFVEYGTLPHLISVQDSEKRRYVNRRGVIKTVSMTTINRGIRSGSLKIGQNFVGPVVQHPGARAIPFMRPALDRRARDAIAAIGDYLRKRIRLGSIQSDGISVDEESA